MTGLNYSSNPIPTIHPTCVPLSQATFPSEPSKAPKVSVFISDELIRFKSKFEIQSFDYLVRFVTKSEEYNGFQFDISNNSITAYRVDIFSGIKNVK